MQETSEQAGPARPTAITIIAWVFIALGILMLLSACLAIVAHMLMKAMAGGNMPLPAENAPAPFQLMARIFRYIDILAYFQIALASFIMLAGYYFLKLRKWARTALEAVSWLGAAYILGFGVFWIIAWTSATGTMPAPEQAILEQVSPAPAGPIVNNIMSYSGSGDVTAPVRTVNDIRGCNAADFAGFPAGSIALISRGACTFAIKATNACNAGASGVIIYNNAPGVINGTLGNGFSLNIGVTSVTQAVGQQLAATAGLVMRLKTDTFRGIATTYNVLAESKGGDPNNVVMVGAHLDSVNAGPGIQDAERVRQIEAKAMKKMRELIPA